MRGMMRLALLGVPGASGASAFSPDDYGGLGLWIDASHAASLYQDSAGTTPAAADGDPVGRAGRVATNLATQDTTSNKPTLKLNIQNGLPVIRFDAADFMSLSNLALLRNVPSVSAFFVGSYPDASVQRLPLYYSVGTSALGRFNLGASLLPGETWGIGGRRLDTDSFVSIAATAGDVTGKVIQSGMVDYANSRGVMWLNGTQAAISEAFQTDGNTSDTSSQAAKIGGATTGNFGGDLCEMLVFVPALNDTQRQAVEAYLSEKWGVTLA